MHSKVVAVSFRSIRLPSPAGDFFFRGAFPWIHPPRVEQSPASCLTAASSGFLLALNWFCLEMRTSSWLEVRATAWLVQFATKRHQTHAMGATAGFAPGATAGSSSSANSANGLSGDRFCKLKVACTFIASKR